MKKLNFITHNKNKYLEAKILAKEYNLDINWINVEYDEIQHDNLDMIAKRSCEIMQEKKIVEGKFIVEDAGLFIESLNSFPGPYSAYCYLTIGNQGILNLIKSENNRKAYFKSVIAYAFEERITLFTGITDGEITNEMRGEKGFGFDPIFQPLESDKTFAEMSLKEKNLYSHRQKSLRKLFALLSLRL